MRSSLPRRALGLAALAAAGALSTAGTALADTATLTFLDHTGKDDPALSLPRVATISGNVSGASTVYVKYRAAGGAPCAPTADADPGRPFEGYWGATAPSVNGDFSLASTKTWRTPGDAMFCIWLSRGDASSVTPPITVTATIRRPTGTVRAVQVPSRARAHQRFAVTVRGTSEAPAAVDALVVNGGVTCADGAGRYAVRGTRVHGRFSVPIRMSYATAGRRALCVWVRDVSDNSVVVAFGRFPVVVKRG